MNKNSQKRCLAVALVAIAFIGCVTVGMMDDDTSDSDASSITKSWISISNFSMTVGDILTVTDYGDDDLEVTVTSKPNWSSVSNEILTGTPTSAGTYTLEYSLVDTLEGTTGSYTVTITVNAATTTYYYTLNYDANDGSGAPSSQTKSSTSTSASFTISSVEPTRTGYIFSGWASTSNATSGYYGIHTSTITLSISSGSSTSKTLYAVWTEDVAETYAYSLSFDTNGGTPAVSTLTGSSTALYYDFTVPTVELELSGFIFIGWSLTTDFVAGYGSADYYSGDIVRISSQGSSTAFGMHAVWRSTACTLTFDVNGGSGSVDPIHGTIGETITMPTTEGISNGILTLAGWSESADGSNPIVAGGNYEPTGDLMFYAVWVDNTMPVASFVYSVNELTVTFEDTSVSPNVWQWNFGDTVTSTSQYPEHTYDSAGTYTVTLSVSNAAGSNSYSAIVIVGSSSNTIYTVSFNSGSDVDSMDVTFGTMIILPGSPKTGYVFTGWYYEDVFIGNSGSTYKVTGSIELVAKYTSESNNVYLISFVDKDGTILTEQSVVSGGLATFVETEGINGKTCSGWYYNGTQWNFGTAITSNVTLVAEYTTSAAVDYAFLIPTIIGIVCFIGAVILRFPIMFLVSGALIIGGIVLWMF